ncbi:ciliary microtubule-associated protein 3-like isoform X2 [Passer domesticus]|uniref:ciliary microtubule-associated protein 3-like isoform X2 n=1 Tax=Passer domesticus TaxID=48849 RepID=UPI0030FEF7E1
MAARPDPKAGAKLISFGTTQDRKMFPYHCAPDRLGIEMLGPRGSPWLGPGSYLGPESSVLQPWESRRPLSSRGYAVGARTAPRFQHGEQAGRVRHPRAPGPARGLARPLRGPRARSAAAAAALHGEDAGAEDDCG